MKRWPILLYPVAFRRRYGDEVAELLDHSPHPVRDGVDTAVHAGRLRLEILMSNAARHVANLVLAAAIFLLGFSLNELRHGITEAPEHWWSSAAILFVFLAGAARGCVAAVEARPRHRTSTVPN